MIKKILCLILGLCFMLPLAFACDKNPATSSPETKDPTPKGTVIPTVYNTDEIVEADQTKAGDIDSWQAQVFTSKGGNNDYETPNAVIHSPWHTLKINGVEVPVYSARCGKGTHSFAWVDVADSKRDFCLKVELTLTNPYGKCVVLPESRKVDVQIAGNNYTSYITEYGSFTYTFAKKASKEVTDPTLAPLTLMVAEDKEMEVPAGYTVHEIEPGYHETDSLEFTEEETVYCFKAGLHEISNIRIPSNSVLHIERGAYLKVTDRQYADDSWNTDSALDIRDAENVQVYSRGLFDIGEVLGGDHKRKHVVGVVRSTDVTVEGLTIINANTWTMCFYNCVNAVIERNLLLAYRTYSDGIMMSECVDSVGRYNFVRTGDDAIEYKGTGWNRRAINMGENCLYEYNDLWTDKGSGYCLTWESECDMTNMKFKNNSVGFAQPTWSSGNNALDCRLGTNAKTTWGEVTFEDIEIYHVISPQVIITQISGQGANLRNITFKDITVKSTELGVKAYTMEFTAKGGTIENIVIDNFNFCGKVLTDADRDNPILFGNRAGELFNELTIK